MLASLYSSTGSRVCAEAKSGEVAQIQIDANKFMGIMIISIMIAMTMEVTRVEHLKKMQGVVQTHIEVQVPGLNARAMIEMEFSIPTGTSRNDWAEIAYEKALLMLDPA